MKKLINVFSVLIMLPIRFYLMWYILKAVNATELPMFLFWCLVPLAIVLGVTAQLIDEENKGS